MKPCIYRQLFHYNPCRDCSGLDTNCRNYQSQIIYEVRKRINPNWWNVESIVNLESIREINDGGVIA